MGLRSWRTVVELMEALRKRLGLASGRVLIVVVAVAALVVAGGVAAAVRVQSTSGRILAGVRIDGVDVGGMTREQALAAVRQHVAPTLSSKVAVLARGGRWHVTPSGLGRTPKIDQAVDQALDGPGLPLLSNLWHRGSGRPGRCGLTGPTRRRARPSPSTCRPTHCGCTRASSWSRPTRWRPPARASPPRGAPGTS